MGLSVAVVGLFGFLSWSLTARLADPSLVGTASALINAMLLAATIGQLQLGNVILRWLPEAGGLGGTLLRRSYATVIVVCLPVAVVVALLMPDRIISSTGEIAVFCLAVVVWSLFSLQDQVLAGLWRASVIPIENGAFVLLRLGLILLLVQYGQIGVLAAWILPAMMMVAVVSCFLPRLLKRARSLHPVGGCLPSRPDLVQFVAGNFSASLAQLAVWNGLPMLVTSLAGTAQGGIFFIVWSIVVSVELAAIGFAQALVVRAGGNLDRLRQLTRVTGLWFAAAFLPALLLVAVLARPILSLFGPAYADGGTSTLQLLMAGVACRLVPTLAIGVAQVRKESRIVIALQGGFAFVLLGGVVVALTRSDAPHELSQVAAIYFAGSALTALASAVYLFRSHLRRRLPPFGTPALVISSFVCWWWGARLTDPADLGLLGLLDALHPLAWCGVCLMVVAMVAEIGRRNPRAWWGYLLTVAVTVEAYALQPLIYGEARLPVAWLHAGWADYVAANGAVAQSFDARFSWPGFFETIAMLCGAGGLDSATSMLRWAPVFFLLVWLIPLTLIGRSLQLNTRTLLVALWIFLAGNWVEQEYFSPQALAYVLYLSIVGLCMRLLCRDRGRHAVAQMIGYVVETRLRRGRVAAVPIVIFVTLALAPSHQLTPYLLLVTLTILVMAAGLRPWSIILIAAVAPMCWLVLGAHDFWSGHSDMITQDVGAVGQAVDSNVIARVEGSPQRMWAQIARLVVVGIVLLLAAIGACRLWKDRRRATLIVSSLAFVPVTFIFVQSYGGEMILRSWLFALPWLAILAANSLVKVTCLDDGFEVHLSPRRNAVRVGALACVLLSLTTAGLFSRSSNDGFTRVSSDQVAVMRRVYESMESGERLAVLSSYLPWKFAKITDIIGIPINDRCPDTVSIANCVVQSEPDLLVVTKEQQTYGRLVESYPPGFTDAVIQQLLDTRTFQVVEKKPDITVLRRYAPVVLAIGDSVTRGDADPAQDVRGDRAWPGLMHDKYPKSFDTVINAGVQGNWTTHMRERLAPLLAAHHPDLVVIYGGTNDVWQRGSLKVAAKNLTAMAESVKAAGAQPILVTIPPQEFHGGRTNKKSVNAMNAAIKKVGVKTGSPVVDAYRGLATAKGTWQEGLTLDGIHPSRLGALHLADLMDVQIEKLTNPPHVGPFGPVHKEIISNAAGSQQ